MMGEPLTTAGGGSFVRGEVNRNERAARWAVATIEVADIPFRDTLPLQMLTQQMLNSNFAIGSFIVKHWRSHIFPHRNTRTGCPPGR